MLGIRALKSEMAKAVLAAGIAGATPAFAQDNTDSPSPETTISTTQTQVDSTIDWYNPDVPEEVLWGLMLLAGLGGGYMAMRGHEGTRRRGLAMAAGFAALANPQTVSDEYRVLPTIIPVFVDTSASVGDRAPMVEEAFARLENDLTLLGPVSIRRVEFGEDELSRARPGTHLSDVMSATLDTIPIDQIGATFVITDGVISDQSAIMNIETLGKPTHALIAGHDQEQDFFVTIEQAPHIGIVGETPDVVFRVSDGRTPDSTNLRADVRITFGDNQALDLSVPVNQDHTISTADLAAQGLELGDNILGINITSIEGATVAAMDRNNDGQPDEVSILNNRITTSIEGIDSEIKVLYLSGEPHAGTRLWRDEFNNDPNISLTHIGYLRPPHKEDATPLREMATTSFPAAEILQDQINEFDLIVMDSMTFTGEISPRYFENIRDYVLQGGPVIITGNDDIVAPNGLSRTPIGEIMPVTPYTESVDQRFVPQVTDEGLRHPVGRILMNAQGGEGWGPWYSIAPSELSATDARVILSDEQNNPLLTLNEVGEGRVAVLNSDQAILWARGHQGGGPANILYQAMTGWALEHPRYEEEGLSLRHEGDQLTAILQTMKDTPSELIITTPSGEEIAVTPTEQAPGVYSATIPADEQGAYTVRRVGEAESADYAVSGFPDPAEMQALISDTEILRPVTDATGGQVVRIGDETGAFIMPSIVSSADMNENPSALQVNMSEKRELTGTQRTPLIPEWIYMLLFAGLMTYSFKPKTQNNTEWVKSLADRMRKDPQPPEPGA